MSVFALILIALAMSSDAFAASISKGAQLKSPRILNALKMGLIFGVIEGITPIIGWALGSAGSSYVQEIDHWIAFILLVSLGLHMLHVSFQPGETEISVSPASKKRALAATILTALGTSIDAMTVGVTFAFLDVNIVVAAALIGLATAIMVTIGALLGTSLGVLVGKKAEAVGGIIVIIIGSWTLYSHLRV
ncbi:MAG: manganese efflux pump MntP family protein [Paraglaciecola sp.]|nr:manganese efflux pump MntP family protein [Paraglaciecola sp.]NCT47714.1 manganese efflux pump MntP family protein [Paraglaciecola sp.]